MTFPDQQCKNVRAHHKIFCWCEKIRLNNQIKELSVPQLSVTLNSVRILFPWCYVICKNIVSSLKRYPLSHSWEHNKMFKQTFSSLKYKHVVKWDSASHCLILIHIGSSKNWYLNEVLKRFLAHRHQINSHYISAKVVRVVKWHYTTAQTTTCVTRLPRSSRQDDNLNVCVICPEQRPHSWWEGEVWGHWGSL